MVKKMKSSRESGKESAKVAGKEAGKESGKDSGSAQSMGSRFSKGAAGLLDSQLAASVKESAQQIWLAGMGAFAKAQQEGGKVFDTLVKEGVSLQQKTQGRAEDRFGDVSGKMSAMADAVTARAGENWDKLEGMFEQRTAKTLGKLGVPTAKDMDALGQRVNALAAAVAALSKAPRAASSSASAKAPAKKAAAKTVAVQRAAAAPAAAKKAAPAAKRARKTAAV